MLRAEHFELKSHIVWSRLSLTVVGVLFVVIGTLLPYEQFVDAQAKLPLWVHSQNDWLGYPILSLTHDPGLVIAIAAFLTVVLEVRAQWQFMEIQRGNDEWKPGSLGLEFAAVMMMALVALLSWPFRGQDFAINSHGVLLHGQGVGTVHTIALQVVVFRGFGGVVSFIGIALLFFALYLQAVALWRIRPGTQTGQGLRVMETIKETQNTQY
jgi:hypothetical protein